MTVSGSKRCRECDTTRPLSDFHRNKNSADGRAAVCRPCRLAKEAERRRARGVPERPVYDDSPGSKTCRKCKTQKAVAEFRAAPRNADGLQSWCRACQNADSSTKKRAKTAARARKRAANAPPPGWKKCSQCGEVKQVDDYYRYHRSSDGHEAACKDCQRLRKGHAKRRVDAAPPGSKTCSMCDEVKPLDAFYNDPRTPRAVTSACKECRREAAHQRKLERGEPTFKRYDDPPGVKTCRSCEVQKPLDEFGDEPRNRDGLRSWCDDCQRARTLQWHRDNPDAIFRLKSIRRVLEEEYPVSRADLRGLMARHDGTCAYCGVAEAKSIDHVVPVTRGGKNSIGNLVPCCRPCNSSKGNKLLSEWRYRRGPGRRRRRRIDPLPRPPTPPRLP